MIIYIATFTLGMIVASVFMHILGVRKERLLFDSLEKMIDDAAGDRFETSKYTEEELSLVENKLKRLIERSSLSKEMQKEQKEKIQELISDIAHQTLTPVSNLRLYSDLLQEKYVDDTLVAAVADETEKLDFLISSLVKVSRMENGIISVNPNEMPVERLLDAVEGVYVHKAREKEIEFYVTPFEESAVYDLKWTAEAVFNIVDNAVKYTPAGGRISISCEKYSFYTRIDISDTGIGISGEDIPKIFKRFYRSFDVSNEPGVGIGLYLAKYIIEKQKGYIRVSSEKGKGSVFSIFLPCR